MPRDAEGWAATIREEKAAGKAARGFSGRAEMHGAKAPKWTNGQKGEMT